MPLLSPRSRWGLRSALSLGGLATLAALWLSTSPVLADTDTAAGSDPSTSPPPRALDHLRTTPYATLGTGTYEYESNQNQPHLRPRTSLSDLDGLYRQIHLSATALSQVESDRLTDLLTPYAAHIAETHRLLPPAAQAAVSAAAADYRQAITRGTVRTPSQLATDDFHVRWCERLYVRQFLPDPTTPSGSDSSSPEPTDRLQPTDFRLGCLLGSGYPPDLQVIADDIQQALSSVPPVTDFTPQTLFSGLSGRQWSQALTQGNVAQQIDLTQALESLESRTIALEQWRRRLEASSTLALHHHTGDITTSGVDHVRSQLMLQHALFGDRAQSHQPTFANLDQPTPPPTQVIDPTTEAWQRQGHHREGEPLPQGSTLEPVSQSLADALMTNVGLMRDLQQSVASHCIPSQYFRSTYTTQGPKGTDCFAPDSTTEVAASAAPDPEADTRPSRTPAADYLTLVSDLLASAQCVPSTQSTRNAQSFSIGSTPAFTAEPSAQVTGNVSAYADCVAQARFQFSQSLSDTDLLTRLTPQLQHQVAQLTAAQQSLQLTASVSDLSHRYAEVLQCLAAKPQL